MQNKGLVRVFAILFGLVCLYQLSYTFITNSKESDAEAYAVNKYAEGTKDYAKLREAAEKSYLDSIGNDKVLGTTYNEAKKKELNKGLDLKGGINVILQISVKDILKGLANGSKNPAFNQALVKADEIQKDAQEPYVESFFTAFDALPDAKLATPEIFLTKDLDGKVIVGMSNDEVKPVIRKKINESIISAFEVLRKRIDKFGVSQPNIQRIGESGRILVELPGARDIERVKKLVTSTAQLEFWDVYKFDDVIPFLSQANELLKIETVEEDAKPADASNESEIDSLLEDADAVAEKEVVNPLFDLLVRDARSKAYPGGPIIATIAKQDTAQFMGYINSAKVRGLLTGQQRYTRFAWGKAEEGSTVFDLYAIKANRQNKPELSGNVVTDAQQTYTQRGQVAVSMQMNGKGAKVWADMTGRASQQQSQIAIVLDNVVYSAPGVSSGAITGGRSEITGNFDILEAKDLSNVLRAGKLPASADIIQSEIVGPSLGQEAIDSGVLSFLIALALVLVWMVFYYGKAGIYADIALVVNILFIFGVLAGLKAVLTLPGIAGIVLTIGMSVDANVLIFERIREELSKGKSQVEAIKDGFGNALSSILDANITTGLTGVILLVFGSGPIKGFATTLLIGILTSLFTAIFITRLFIDRNGKKGNDLAFSTAITKKWFRNFDIQFLKKRKLAYILSGAIILTGLGSLFTQGLDQGVDFVGGRTYTVRFDSDVNTTEVDEALTKVFGSAEAKTFGAANQLKITTKYKIDESGSAVDDEIQEKLYGALKPYLSSDLSYASFVSGEEAKVEGVMSSMKVGPTIADDIKKTALWAVLGSLLVVFLYILFRFRYVSFSLGAVAAVFHDVLIVLGLFSLLHKVMPFNMEIDQAFIAAILTVIGYSLNDTVVVFDRIREFLYEYKDWTLVKVVDSALSSTLSRTINTSLTTLLVLVTIFIFAAPLRGFMFSMIIGVIVGTYSSVFIATPIMFDSAEKFKLKEKIQAAEEAKLAAEAERLEAEKAMLS